MTMQYLYLGIFVLLIVWAVSGMPKMIREINFADEGAQENPLRVDKTH